MENLLDIGVEEYRIGGGGVLRFHPGDPNLYGRFLQAEKDFDSLQAAFAEKAASGQEALAQMEAADRKMKEILNTVFGGDNDFHKALGSVNLLAVGADGVSVAARLLQALEKILTQGASRFAKQQAAQLKIEN